MNYAILGLLLLLCLGLAIQVLRWLALALAAKPPLLVTPHLKLVAYTGGATFSAGLSLRLLALVVVAWNDRKDFELAGRTFSAANALETCGQMLWPLEVGLLLVASVRLLWPPR